MSEFLPGILIIVAGLAMVIFRDAVALMQASALGLIMGMANARKMIPFLKIEVVVGGLIFSGVGVYLVVGVL